MYLSELLTASKLTRTPNEDAGQIVLLPEGIHSWVDVPLVVDRVDWEAIYVKYRSQEPDTEVILNGILSKNRDLLRDLASCDDVRDEYMEKRDELAQSEADEQMRQAAEEEAVVLGSVADDSAQKLESEEKQKMYDGYGQEQDFMFDESGMAPSMNDDMDPETRFTGYAGESDEASESERLSPGSMHAAVDAAIDPAMSESLQSEIPSQSDNVKEGGAFDGFRDDFKTTPPLTDTASESFGELKPEDDYDLKPEDSSPSDGAEEWLGGGQTAGHHDVSFVDDGVSIDSSYEGATAEYAKQEQELSAFAQYIETYRKFPEKLPEWCISCVEVYQEMYTDFQGVFADVDPVSMLAQLYMTPAVLLEKITSLSWTPSYVQDQCGLPDTGDEFLYLLLVACYQSLEYILNGQEDAGVKLAEVFSQIIYEE